MLCEKPWCLTPAATNIHAWFPRTLSGNKCGSRSGDQESSRAKQIHDTTRPLFCLGISMLSCPVLSKPILFDPTLSCLSLSVFAFSLLPFFPLTALPLRYRPTSAVTPCSPIVHGSCSGRTTKTWCSKSSSSLGPCQRHTHGSDCCFEPLFPCVEQRSTERTKI